MYKLFIFSLVSLYANFSFGAVCDTVIVGNGTRYEGQYPCGEGVLYSDSLGIFIGHFENGVPNGVCTHYKKNGHRYYGEFEDGKNSGSDGISRIQVQSAWAISRTEQRME